MPTPSVRQVVMIGASDGGVDAFVRLGGRLQADFAAPVVMLLHRLRNGTEDYTRLAGIVQSATVLPVRIGVADEPLQPGCTYLPRPGRQLCLRGDGLCFEAADDGARWAPSIDALFDSGARRYGAGAIAVMLTGMLDDGVAGLNAVTDAGGVTLVQLPAEAQAPAMPQAALRRDHPSYVAPLDELVPVLEVLTGSPGLPGEDTPAIVARAADRARVERRRAGGG